MTPEMRYYSGLAAEESVMTHYTARGYQNLEKRWRCGAGEIDLIFEDNGKMIFVEVKKAASFAQAAERVTRRQIDRILEAAQGFLAQSGLSANVDMRFDVALVDERGAVELIENAF